MNCSELIHLIMTLYESYLVIFKFESRSTLNLYFDNIIRYKQVFQLLKQCRNGAVPNKRENKLESDWRIILKWKK